MNLPKPIYLLVLFVAGLLAPISGIANTTLEEAKQTIQFRQIGHEFLLSLGDYTSRISPVQKISNTEYRLEFEKPFAFIPDSLVATVGRIMKRGELSSDYVITVTEQETQQVVYGFTTRELKDGNVPCIGRALPLKSYAINIFIPGSPGLSSMASTTIYISITISLLIVGLVFITRKKLTRIKGTKNDRVTSKSISIGKYLFYPEEQLLICNSEQTPLSAKERKLLSIFTTKPNQVIDRNSLLKEGWEDEGVITGRSLDVYVSKLRKKLQKDTSVTIVNVHGKGYSLNTK